jgi:hypothetical protein
MSMIRISTNRARARAAITDVTEQAMNKTTHANSAAAKTGRWGFSVLDRRGRQLLLPRATIAEAIAAFVNLLQPVQDSADLIDKRWEALRIQFGLRISRVEIKRPILLPTMRPWKRTRSR